MRCAVLGSPIAHSLSPAMHRAAYDHLGLDWSYDAVEVESPDLERFLDGLDGTWRGLSLTMPLKRTVVPLVDSLDDWSELSGVANTVLLADGRRQGCNTDIPGAMAALAERVQDPLRSAVVIGGGATAASVLLALAELGCTTARVLVREPSRAEQTLVAVAAHPRAPELSVGTIAEASSLPQTWPQTSWSRPCRLMPRHQVCLRPAQRYPRSSRSSTTRGQPRSRPPYRTAAVGWSAVSTCSRTRPCSRWS